MRKPKFLLASFALSVMLLALASVSHAQQDPMFTKYMFNSLAFNPAYAGSKEYLSATAIVRDQWLNWGKGSQSANGGAPITYAASVHMPFKERVGLGGYISQDDIGSSSATQLTLAYAYQFPVSETMKLSLGLQGGVTHHRFDYSGLVFRDDQSVDDSFANDPGQTWRPNAGAGAYVYTEKFYAGASIPRLFETSIREDDLATKNGLGGARNYRHLYLMTGAAFPLGSKDLVFKPSLLVKGVGWFGDFSASSQQVQTVRTPTEFDIDASFLIRETLWLGASFRSTVDYLFEGESSHDSADLWAAFYLKNGLRIGLAYDYSLTGLQQFGNGSAELMIGYDMNFNVEKLVTPRYF